MQQLQGCNMQFSSVRNGGDEEPCKHLINTVVKTLQDALTEIEKVDHDPTRAVHECRKHLKIARALLDMARKANGGKGCDDMIRGLRDAGRILADTRNEAAMIEILSVLAGRNPGPDRQESYKSLTSLCSRRYEERIAELLRTPIPVQETACRITNILENCVAVLGDGPPKSHMFERAERAYRRARNDMILARNSRTPESLHEWRKTSKTLRYQEEYFLRNGIPLPEHFPVRLHQLTDYLGNAHDAALLLTLLRNDKTLPLSNIQRTWIGDDAVRYFMECAANAFQLGGKLFRGSPQKYRRLIHRSCTSSTESINTPQGSAS